MTDSAPAASATPPILLFAVGNPSRGDDALGPLLLARLADAASPTLEMLTDFQLQIEHTLDLRQRRLVLFVDASVAPGPALRLTRLHPARERAYTSHALAPAALLKLYREIHDAAPPACFQLAIAGHQFALGAPLSGQAEANLRHAERLVRGLLQRPEPDEWISASHAATEITEGPPP